MAAELTQRGVAVCRGCGADSLESVLDLGRQPIANELATRPDAAEPTFPLHLRICTDCALGQVGEYLLPDRIFPADYPYFSSVSQSWVEHARSYAAAMAATLDLTAKDLVVEVASNDGYLLAELNALGTRTLGIEPARRVAEAARERGVETIEAFFGESAARRVVQEHGRPRLVAANNVLAHVPDLDDFMAGLSVLCGDDTVVTIENPSFLNLLVHTQFDTIYHEHFSYLSAHAIQRLALGAGLKLVRVEQLSTHGGSNRYWLQRDVGQHTPSVERFIESELRAGLLDPRLWTQFDRSRTKAVAGLTSWLGLCGDERRRVVAYGAAAKGNTLLNAAGVRHEQIDFVVDASPEKQGKYLPGSGIPIVAPQGLAGSGATDVLVLPWNLVGELAPLIRRLTPQARTWTAIPRMEEHR